jgi:predicted amidophosphoribosyltransferase
MHITKLEFGSLLTYSPYGMSERAKSSRNVMSDLKGDKFISEHLPVLMSKYLAQGIKTNLMKYPFAHFFESSSILVPTPKSSLVKPETLWVPQRLALALAQKQLGKAVKECLVRVKPLPKSSTTSAEDRPKALQHYESLEVRWRETSKPKEILLIDDIVTRGATLLGAANRLIDTFPDAHIRAFAMMRTMSGPSIFDRITDPCIGWIELRGNDTYRTP